MLRSIAKCLISRGQSLNLVSRTRSLNGKFHTSAKYVLFSEIDKDLPVPTEPTPITKLYDRDTDILLEQLHKAKNLDRVLNLISMHIDVMNDRHLSESFSIIHNVTRFEEDRHGIPPDLTQDPSFQALCSKTMKRARYLQNPEVLTTVKTLTFLGVKSNTYVMQSLLKMLCSRLNDLNLSELVFLNFLLTRHGVNSIVDSLRLALPLVLQVQIDTQLDSQNINEVVSCLKIACKANLKPATIQKVVSSLNTRAPSFSTENAATVIFALFTLSTPVDDYMSLLKSCFDTISNDVGNLSKHTVLSIVRLCKKQSFLYRTFFLSVVKKIISEQWQLEDSYDVVNVFYRLNFFSSELLDHLTKRILGNPKIVISNPKYSILTVTEQYSFADYKTTNVHSVLDVLSSAEEKLQSLQRSSPHLYIKLISCWAALGYFHEDLLSRVLNETYLFDAWSYSRKSGRNAEFELFLCNLQWALEIYDKVEQYTLPTNVMKKIIENIHHTTIKSKEYPLTKFLENGLGGPQFFHTGLITHNGHIIDHAIIMRSGNYPMSLSSLDCDHNSKQSVCYLEDILVPEDSKIVTVITAYKDQYCWHPDILKLPVAVKIKNLSKMSYSPIVVNYEKWLELPDREKIPYLMREIKDAVQPENLSNTLYSRK